MIKAAKSWGHGLAPIQIPETSRGIISRGKF